MKLEAGQTLLHYRLVDKIGEGGMGEVHRDAIHAGGQSGAGVAGYP